MMCYEWVHEWHSFGLLVSLSYLLAQWFSTGFASRLRSCIRCVQVLGKLAVIKKYCKIKNVILLVTFFLSGPTVSCIVMLWAATWKILRWTFTWKILRTHIIEEKLLVKSRMHADLFVKCYLMGLTVSCKILFWAATWCPMQFYK